MSSDSNDLVDDFGLWTNNKANIRINYKSVYHGICLFSLWIEVFFYCKNGVLS